MAAPFANLDTEAITRFAVHTGAWDFMHTTWGWPLVESIHFIGLSLLLGTVGLLDLRMMGLFRGVSMAALHRLIPFGVAGFVINVLTGALFFINAPEQYFWNPAFRLKVLAMTIAGVNVIVFYSTVAKAVKSAGAHDLPPVPARIMAGISLLAWTSVVIFGRVITGFRPPWHWDYLFF